MSYWVTRSLGDEIQDEVNARIAEADAKRQAEMDQTAAAQAERDRTDREIAAKNAEFAANDAAAADALANKVYEAWASRCKDSGGWVDTSGNGKYDYCICPHGIDNLGICPRGSTSAPGTGQPHVKKPGSHVSNFTILLILGCAALGYGAYTVLR